LEVALLAGVRGQEDLMSLLLLWEIHVTKVWSSHNVIALLVKEDSCGVCLEVWTPEPMKMR